MKIIDESLLNRVSEQAKSEGSGREGSGDGSLIRSGIGGRFSDPLIFVQKYGGILTVHGSGFMVQGSWFSEVNPESWTQLKGSQ